jgi:multidrug resistance efflux pump
MEPLLGQGFVTAQQVDQARTTQRTAQIALQQAQLQADEARQAINTKPTEAELGAGAGAELAAAAPTHAAAPTRPPNPPSRQHRYSSFCMTKISTARIVR